MSYPVLNDVFRAQVNLHGNSGLPEDVHINNLYFHQPGGSAAPENMASQIAAVLDDFYSETPAGATAALSTWLSNEIASVSYKVYNLGSAPPRYPVVPALPGGWTPSAGTRLPSEVAVCLSFKSGPEPRNKGRIYIGPLKDSTLGGTSPTRPDPDFMDDLAKAASQFLIDTPLPVTWVQVSPTYAEYNPVLEGWVDNAFDTQRSRGPAATSRVRYDSSGIIF